jgi:hypothetical protein
VDDPGINSAALSGLFRFLGNAFKRQPQAGSINTCAVRDISKSSVAFLHRRQDPLYCERVEEFHEINSASRDSLLELQEV